VRTACLIWVILCTLVITEGCRSPSPDWNGTWQLNFVKSTWKGPVFTISISPDGKYHWSDSNSSYSFRCDGQFRSIGGNRTQACTISSATVLDLIRKEKGVTTNSYRWEVSGAGKVYTATSTTVALSHAAPANQVVASRISGSNGFAGQWRNNTYLQQHAEMTLRRDGQDIHINYPNGLYSTISRTPRDSFSHEEQR
jgi:hypothetical protein